MDQPTILVVEDNPMLQKMLSMMAKRSGVDAVIVGSCAEALQMVAANSHDFKMVLMDWGLPDHNGLACTGQLRAALKSQLPIVAMTGHVMPGDRQACLDAGMNDYLSKPFTFDEFKGKLNMWMDAEMSSVINFPAVPGAIEQQPPV